MLYKFCVCSVQCSMCSMKSTGEGTARYTGQLLVPASVSGWCFYLPLYFLCNLHHLQCTVRKLLNRKGPRYSLQNKKFFSFSLSLTCNGPTGNLGHLSKLKSYRKQPAAQAPVADPSGCNSTNRQYRPIQLNRCNF